MTGDGGAPRDVTFAGTPPVGGAGPPGLAGSVNTVELAGALTSGGKRVGRTICCGSGAASCESGAALAPGPTSGRPPAWRTPGGGGTFTSGGGTTFVR